MDWTSNGDRDDAGRNANTNSRSTQWLPLDWQPAHLAGGSTSGASDAQTSHPQAPARSDWLPAENSPTVWLETQARSVCQPEQAARRSRGLVLIGEHRGLIGAGVALTAIAAPVALDVLRPPVTAGPIAAVTRSPRVAEPTVITSHGHYRVEHRSVVRRPRATLSLALRQGHPTSTLPATSAVVRPAAPVATHVAAPYRPVVHATRPAAVHAAAPVHTASAKQASSTAASSSGANGRGSSSSSGSSPSPSPSPSPAQTVVSTATQTAGQAIQTVDSAVSKVHVP